MNISDPEALDIFIMRQTLNTAASYVPTLVTYSIGLPYIMIVYIIIMAISIQKRIYSLPCLYRSNKFYTALPNESERVIMHLFLFNINFLCISSIITYILTIADVARREANIQNVAYEYCNIGVFDTGLLLLVWIFMRCCISAEALNDNRKMLIKVLTIPILVICGIAIFLSALIYCTLSIHAIPNTAYIRYMYALYGAYPLYAISKIGLTIAFLGLASRLLFLIRKRGGDVIDKKSKDFAIRTVITIIVATLNNVLFLILALITQFAMANEYVMVGIALLHVVPNVVWVTCVVITMFPSEWTYRKKKPVDM